ncbi:hypothetical protein PO909_001083 [Leuciscus waleckii]
MDQCVQGHQANRDSRVLWVKNDNLLTTGFNQVRQQEVRLWDSRKLTSSLSSLSLATSNATGGSEPSFSAVNCSTGCDPGQTGIKK